MVAVSDVGNVYDLRGLKQDLDTVNTEKIGNGSTFLCMDTGEVFIYDKENEKWLAL